MSETCMTALKNEKGKRVMYSVSYYESTFINKGIAAHLSDIYFLCNKSCKSILQ